jgi:phytanoyl-CoA hydroxylase
MINTSENPFESVETFLLGDAERGAYQEQGFFIAKNLVPASLLTALATRLDKAARGELDERIYRQIEPQVKRVGGDMGDPIDYVRKVQKLAENDLFFDDFVTNHRLLSLVHGLYGENIRYFGDEVQLKPAKVGSAHPWHQDAPYFHGEPMDVVTIWIAVDDATRENGCIEVIPGAHKQGILSRPNPERPWFETGELRPSHNLIPRNRGCFPHHM